MRKPKSSLILSPNLGCPEIVDVAAMSDGGFRVILATPDTEELTSSYALVASPSYPAEGQEFALKKLTARGKLQDEALPVDFSAVDQTRLLISTTVRTQLFPGYAFWEVTAQPDKRLGDENLRLVKGERRSTLYDLALKVGNETVGRVRHALCLRPGGGPVNFVHLTDLHVAMRNDVWDSEVRSVVDRSVALGGGNKYKNFNERLRQFIIWANQAADDGQLDFVLALGDLVDFARTGLSDRTREDSNWSTLVDLLTGCDAERARGNLGLKVPIFTATGNHDWRTYPYSPSLKRDAFGISKPCAEELDLWYRNTAVEVGDKLADVQQKLIREGSPLLARSWWGAVITMGLRGLLVGSERLWQRLKAVGVNYGRMAAAALASILGFGGIAGLLGSQGGESSFLMGHPWLLLAVAAALLAATQLAPSWLYAKLRSMLEGLIAIEADVDAIAEYFLRFNPYFNYAFRVGNCYIAVMDTGPDCLTAQSFWDQGGKKVRRISMQDNILGGSPDSMAFYPANEYYPYSQIAWLENVLRCISKETHQNAAESRKCRIFVGLHAPPANLPERQRRKADRRLAGSPSPDGVFMRKRRFGGFDTAYGTVNHYLSQLFYLCLGYREAQRDAITGPGVDAVLAGHAHWTLEFRLRKPDGDDPEWSPQHFYGSFSKQVEADCSDPGAWWGPLLLQTAACGPESATDPDPPHFRYIAVNPDGRVAKLAPRNLKHPPVFARATGAGQK